MLFTLTLFTIFQPPKYMLTKPVEVYYSFVRYQAGFQGWCCHGRCLAFCRWGSPSSSSHATSCILWPEYNSVLFPCWKVELCRVLCRIMSRRLRDRFCLGYQLLESSIAWRNAASLTVISASAMHKWARALLSTRTVSICVDSTKELNLFSYLCHACSTHSWCTGKISSLLNLNNPLYNSQH